MRVKLVKNELKYVDQIYQYSQENHVREALKLAKGTILFSPLSVLDTKSVYDLHC